MPIHFNEKCRLLFPFNNTLVLNIVITIPVNGARDNTRKLLAVFRRKMRIASLQRSFQEICV